MQLKNMTVARKIWLLCCVIWGLFMGTRYVCKLVFFWGVGEDNICNSVACEWVFVGCLGSRSRCPVYTYYTWVCRTGRGNIWPSSILLITWRYERTYILVHIYQPATEPEFREKTQRLIFYSRSRIRERTNSLRFLSIFLTVLRLEVSVWNVYICNVYITNQFLSPNV